MFVSRRTCAHAADARRWHIGPDDRGGQEISKNEHVAERRGDRSAQNRAVDRLQAGGRQHERQPAPRPVGRRTKTNGQRPSCSGKADTRDHVGRSQTDGGAITRTVWFRPVKRRLPNNRAAWVGRAGRGFLRAVPRWGRAAKHHPSRRSPIFDQRTRTRADGPAARISLSIRRGHC